MIWYCPSCDEQFAEPDWECTLRGPLNADNNSACENEYEPICPNCGGRVEEE